MMEQVNRTFILLATVCSILIAQGIGHVLVGCGSAGRIEIGGFTNNSVTCTGFSHSETMVWSLVNMLTNETKTIGECKPNNNCNSWFSSFNITRLTASSSFLRIFNASVVYKDYSVTCYSPGRSDFDVPICRFDFIYPANISLCAINVTRDPWQLRGSCEIDSVYSSSGYYMCEWYRGISKFSKTVKITSTEYTPTEHINPVYRQGMCNFTVILNESTHYFYKAVVHPGQTEYDFENVNFETPSIPVIKCEPQSWVPEDSRMYCTCRTNNLGQPEGRLQWIFNGTVMMTGEYGIQTLDMTSLLQRSNDGNHLRCLVDWISRDHFVTYSLRVAYKPSTIQLMLNNVSTALSVYENVSVTFECRANGRPPPNISLFKKSRSSMKLLFTSIADSGNVAEEETRLVTSISSASCLNSSIYLCTADNNFGEVIQTSVHLYIECTPRIPEQWKKKSLVVERREQAVQVSFELVAYPVPNAFNFYCLGSTANLSNVSMCVNNELVNASCWQERDISLINCSVVVHNISVGYYQVTVGNSKGQINITFQVISGTKKRDAVGNLNALSVLGVLCVIIFIMIIIKRRRRHNCITINAMKERHQQIIVTTPDIPLGTTDTSVDISVEENESYASEKNDQSTVNVHCSAYSKSNDHLKTAIENGKPTRSRMKLRNTNCEEAYGCIKEMSLLPCVLNKPKLGLLHVKESYIYSSVNKCKVSDVNSNEHTGFSYQGRDHSQMQFEHSTSLEMVTSTQPPKLVSTKDEMATLALSSTLFKTNDDYEEIHDYINSTHYFNDLSRTVDEEGALNKDTVTLQSELQIVQDTGSCRQGVLQGLHYVQVGVIGEKKTQEKQAQPEENEPNEYATIFL